MVTDITRRVMMSFTSRTLINIGAECGPNGVLFTSAHGLGHAVGLWRWPGPSRPCPVHRQVPPGWLTPHVRPGRRALKGDGRGPEGPDIDMKATLRATSFRASTKGHSREVASGGHRSVVDMPSGLRGPSRLGPRHRPGNFGLVRLLRPPPSSFHPRPGGLRPIGRRTSSSLPFSCPWRLTQEVEASL